MAVKCVYRGWPVCEAASFNEQRECDCFEKSSIDNRCFYRMTTSQDCISYKAQQTILEAAGKEGEL